MAKTEIYYFSGTGNSLHAAQELAKRLPGAVLIPMAALQKKERIKAGSETVGFVFPVYLMNIPFPVKSVMRRMDLSAARYVFGAATCIGYPGLVDISAHRILKKKGKGLDSFFLLKMACNSPAGVRPVSDKDWPRKITSEKISGLETGVQKQLDLILRAVSNREKKINHRSYSPFRHAWRYFLYLFLAPLELLVEKQKNEIRYYADESCNGCGICEQVCLSGKLKMDGKRPVWRKEVRCHLCYACFNFCPQQAILLKKIYTDKKGRYRYPGTTARDIIRQKQG